MLCNGQSIWASISHAERKNEGNTHHEWAETEDSCSTVLAEHQQGINPVSGDIYSFKTSGRSLTKDLQPSIKSDNDYVVDVHIFMDLTVHLGKPFTPWIFGIWTT